MQPYYPHCNNYNLCRIEFDGKTYRSRVVRVLESVQKMNYSTTWLRQIRFNYT